MYQPTSVAERAVFRREFIAQSAGVAKLKLVVGTTEFTASVLAILLLVLVLFVVLPVLAVVP
jgi:hypothetical protein